jgi:hypothetical protein
MAFANEEESQDLQIEKFQFIDQQNEQKTNYVAKMDFKPWPL